MNTQQAQIAAERQRLAHRILTDEFSQKMAMRLDEHSHIGNFLEWSPTPAELEREIHARGVQLAAYQLRGTREQVSETCADISNMLMRYSQLYGS